MKMYKLTHSDNEIEFVTEKELNEKMDALMKFDGIIPFDYKEVEMTPKDHIERLVAESINNDEEVDVTARKIWEQVVKPIWLMKENKVQFAKRKCKEQRELCYENHWNMSCSYPDAQFEEDNIRDAIKDAPEPKFN